MATYRAATRPVISFTPARPEGAAPVWINSVKLAYIADVKGTRIGFVQAIRDLDNPEAAALKAGEIGCFAVKQPDLPDQEITLGVITFAADDRMYDRVVCTTYIIAEVN